MLKRLTKALELLRSQELKDADRKNKLIADLQRDGQRATARADDYYHLYQGAARANLIHRLERKLAAARSKNRSQHGALSVQSGKMRWLVNALQKAPLPVNLRDPKIDEDKWMEDYAQWWEEHASELVLLTFKKEEER